MQQTQTFFPVLEAFADGVRLLARDVRFFFLLSLFPFVATLVTLAVVRLAGDGLPMFVLPVLQLPSSFVVGLECALILRLVVLGEAPIISDAQARVARNRSAMQAALVYSCVTFFVGGAYGVMVRIKSVTDAMPDAAVPFMPVAVVLLLAMLWGARWFWLHIPVALDWQVRDMYARLGGWRGSLGVFALFALCSLTVNILASSLRFLLSPFFGSMDAGFGAAFGDAILAAAGVALPVMFTAASIAALKILFGPVQEEEDIT